MTSLARLREMTIADALSPEAEPEVSEKEAPEDVQAAEPAEGSFINRKLTFRIFKSRLSARSG